MLERAARTGINPLKKTYGGAQSLAATHDQDMRARLAELGPAAAGFQGALAYESGGNSRLAAEKAAAVHELISRAASAPAQGLAETRAIQARAAAEKEKITGQLTSNASQAGLFAATRLGDLRSQAADRAIRRDAQKETARHNRVQEQAKPKGKAKAPLTRNQQNAAIDNIAAAREQFRTNSTQKGFNPAGLRASLKIGSAPTTDGKSIKLPKIKSDIEITAGFELAKTGHVSQATFKELKRRGYRVPGSWRPISAPVYRPGNAPSANGQNRPT
jgi:hypothetical protein